MAVSFNSVPKKLSLAGNPVLFYVESDIDMENKAFVSIQMKISFSFEGQTVEFTDQFSISQGNKYAIFDFSEILRNHLKTIYRWAESTDEMIIDRSSDMLLNYSVEAWEKYYDTLYDTTENTNPTTPESNSFYAIGGGLDPEQESVLRSGGSSFYDLWIQSKKKFLTFSPDTQTVHLNQPLKLYWFCQETFTGTAVISFTRLDDGNSELYPLHNSFVANRLYEILLTPSLIEEITAKEISDFNVSISGNRSETKTFIVNRDYSRRNDFFLLKNSLSGIDSLWARGFKKTDLKTKSDIYRITDNNNDVHNPQYVQSRGITSKEITSFIGFVEGDEKAQYYQELLQTDVLMVMDGKYPIRAIRLSESLTLQDDNENGLYQIPFNWKPAYDSRYYSLPLREYYGDLDNYLATYDDVTIFNGNTHYTT